MQTSTLIIAFGYLMLWFNNSHIVCFPPPATAFFNQFSLVPMFFVLVLYPKLFALSSSLSLACLQSFPKVLTER